MNSMRTSAAGRKAIAQREGNKLTAYVDSVGVLTIGVGHTAAAGPPVVKKGMKITAAESDQILSRDLADVLRHEEHRLSHLAICAELARPLPKGSL